MENTTTIYKAYLKKGIKLTRFQLNAVGINARNIYRQIFGQLPEKIQQKEPASLNYAGRKPVMLTFWVFTYPEDFEQVIFNLIDEQVKKHFKC